MKKIIAFDMVSGDKGFETAFEAAKIFLKENEDYKIIGFTNIKEIPEEKKIDRLEYRYFDQKINQEDSPLQIKRKPNSTLVKSIEAVIKGEADAIISPAASGPLVTAGYIMSKTMVPSIKPGFAPIFQNHKGEKKIIVDVGANIDTNAETLLTYAKMGSVYIKSLGINENPRVRLLNIGAEEKKGNALMNEAYQLLKDDKSINFLGNVEADSILLDEEDVIVCDAISGNIALKSYEGAFKLIYKVIKESANDSFMTKLGLGVSKNLRNNLRNIMNSDDVGGAIVLGLNHLIVKSHGGSDSKYLINSLNVTKKLIELELIEKIRKII